MPDHRIIFPSNIDYSCVRCGACCRNWQIPIGEEEAERFRATDWHASFTAAAMPEADLVRDGVYEPREEVKVELKKTGYLSSRSNLKYNFKMRSDKSCVFLRPDNACHMHAEKGFDYKAFTCKSFPVRLLYLPDGAVQVNYSFYCPGVYGEGRPSNDAAHIEKLIECDNDRTVAEPRLEFDGGVEVEYADMLEINHFVSDFLFAPENASHLNDANYSRDEDLWRRFGSGLNLDKRMAVALYLVLFLARLVSKLRLDDPAGYLDKFRGELANKTVLKKLVEKCCDIYDNSPAKNIGPLILMAFISLHQAGTAEVSNFTKMYTIFTNMIKCSTGWGRFSSAEYGLDFAMKLHPLVRFDSSDAALMAPVEKYISHCIFRKRSFYSSGLLKEYQYITLYYALVKWYSRAYALIRKDAAVSREDIKKAVALIEKGYANHSLLLNVLETNKNFGGIFGSIFGNYSLIKTVTG